MDGGRARLQSTTQRDVSARYPELAGLAEGLQATKAIVDGEVGRDERRGRPRFEPCSATRARPPVAFDLLSLGGRDTIALPYEERCERLLEVFQPGPGRIVPRHQIGDGAVLLQVTSDRGLEGIMAKRLGSPTCPAGARRAGGRSRTGRSRRS
jgi:bifunctional non-homologous end joining protein LigD